MFISIYFLIRTSLPIQRNLPFLFKSSKHDINPTNFHNTPDLSPVKFLNGQKLISEIYKNTPFLFQSKQIVKGSNSASKVLNTYSFFKDKNESKFQKSTFANSISKIGVINNFEKSDEIPSERLKCEMNKPNDFESLRSHKILSFKKEVKVEQRSLPKHNFANFECTKICPLCDEKIPFNMQECPICRIQKDENYFSGSVYVISEGNALLRKQAILVNNEIFFYDKKENNNFDTCLNLNGYYLIDKSTIKDIEHNEIFQIDLFRFDKSFSIYFTEKEQKEKWMEQIKKVIPPAKLLDAYQMKGILGSGKYGIVRRAIHKISMKEVAIKIICKKKRKEKEIELIRNEIAVMNMCQHPNIIQIYDVIENEDYLSIVIENLTGGDLLDYFLKNKGQINENRIASIIMSACNALGYLHNFGIIHRDIKLNNLMLIDNSPNSDIKIVDFGLSKILIPKDLCEEAFGTISFAAPELLLRKPYDFSVDIWSLGVCLFYMLSGDFPFGNDNEDSKEIGTSIVNDNPYFNDDNWINISLDAKDLVNKMLIRDPLLRINLIEILHSQWMMKHYNPSNPVLIQC